MPKLKDIITKQDLIGPDITLNFNGSARGQSIVGGVFSILVKFFLFLVAIYKLSELVLFRSPRISTLDSPIHVSNSHFNHMNLGLMLTFNNFENSE